MLLYGEQWHEPVRGIKIAVSSHTLDPIRFVLPSRTVIEQVDDHTIAIVISRKSRIIMADGQKILDKAAAIQAASPPVTVALKTTAPVCSKTKVFLEEAGVRVLSG